MNDLNFELKYFRIVSHRTASHRIASHRIVSYRIVYDSYYFSTMPFNFTSSKSYRILNVS